MTLTQSTELRGALALSLAAASVVSWRLAPRIRLAAEPFFRAVLAAFALSRLGLFALVYGVLHLVPRGDITLYMDEATHGLARQLVYRDFLTPHAPLSPYLLGCLLAIHNSPFTIMLFCILCDIAAIWLWLRIGRYFLSPLVFRRAALLVLFNPSGLLTTAVDGQINSIVALLLALAVYTLVSHRAILSGAFAALPTALIRFTSLIYAPGFLFASRSKLRATLGFVLVLAVTYGGFALAHADLLVPVKDQGTQQTCSNLIYLFELVTGISLGLRLPDLALAFSWFVTVGILFFAMRAFSANTQPGRRRTLYLLSLSLIAELLCIMTFSKSTWDRYLVMTMFPLCALVAEFTLAQVAAFAIFAAAACWESSFWSSLMFSSALTMHARLLAGDRHALLLLVVEAIESLGTLALWIACLRRLLDRKPLPLPEADLPLLPLEASA